MSLTGAPRRLVCSGCGQRSDDLQPRDAIASLRLLAQRVAALLAATPPGRATGVDAQLAAPWSVPASTRRICEVLAAAERQLRRLLRPHDPEPAAQTPPPAPTEAPDEKVVTPSGGPVSVAECAERLVATIAGVTTESWYRRRPEALSPAELVWLALHDAIHHLEDAELALAPPPVSDPDAVDDALATAHQRDGAVVAMTIVALHRRHQRPPRPTPTRPAATDLASMNGGPKHVTTDRLATMLEAARQQAGLSEEELWFRYFGVGGSATCAEFKAFFTGDSEPNRLQYDMLVSALNECFKDMGLDHPVPYAEEVH